MTGEPKKIYGAAEIAQALDKIAAEIVQAFSTPDHQLQEFNLVGLYQQGVPLAQRLAELIAKRTGQMPTVGKLDISMYRDDVWMRKALPAIKETNIPFAMEEAKIILVDDVLSTGRTIRAALDAVMDYGRPEIIRLAVLIDRGDSEYPIRADFIGMQMHTQSSIKLKVELGESNGQDEGIYETQWKQD